MRVNLKAVSEIACKLFGQYTRPSLETHDPFFIGSGTEPHVANSP
jgi:hypothetical protein